MPEPLWLEILRAVLGAFFGTIGFAMLVHVPKRAWLSSGLIAALSYLVYWGLTRLSIPDPMAIFIGALFGSMAGQLFARKLKIISTVFLMSAIVPVVPGLGLYRMMSFLGRGKINVGAEIGIEAMITVVMIALGLAAGGYTDHAICTLAGKRHHMSEKKITP